MVAAVAAEEPETLPEEHGAEEGAEERSAGAEECAVPQSTLAAALGVAAEEVARLGRLPAALRQREARERKMADIL